MNETDPDLPVQRTKTFMLRSDSVSSPPGSILTPVEMLRKIRLAVANSALVRSYRMNRRRFDYGSIESFIDHYSRAHKEVFFIQVGANDGQTWDPFHFFVVRDDWSGIVIEPQKRVFQQKLTATYGANPRIRLMNVAIDERDGTRTLYRYSFSESRWATGLASFDRDRLIENFATDYVQSNMRREGVSVSMNPDEYLVAEQVHCVTFSRLLEEVLPRRIDFLLVDVEGLDVQILSSFPFDTARPKNIVFEMPATPDQRFLTLLGTLRSNGYDLVIAKNDVLAHLRS